MGTSAGRKKNPAGQKNLGGRQVGPPVLSTWACGPTNWDEGDHGCQPEWDPLFGRAPTNVVAGPDPPAPGFIHSALLAGRGAACGGSILFLIFFFFLGGPPPPPRPSFFI